MAFNYSTNKVATRGLVKIVETNVTGRLVVEDEKIIDRAQGGIGRVSIVSEDRSGDTLQLTGVVNFTALYTLGDKTISSDQVVIDYVDRVDVVGYENVVCVPSVKNYKTTKDSDKSITVSVVVETKVYGVSSEEISVLVGEEENYYTDTKEIELSKMITSTNTSFSVSDTVDISNSEIVSLSCLSFAKEVTAFDNYCVVEGSSIVDVLVKQGEQLKHIQKNIDFKEEIPVLNLTAGATIDFILADKDVTYTIENSNEQDGKAIVDINISFAVWAFEQSAVKIITDAFSDKKNAELTYTHFTNFCVKKTKIGDDRKTIIINVENNKRMDEIVFIGQAITRVDSVVVKDACAKLNGVTSFPVLYKNYDSDDYFNSLLEGNFELTIDLDNVDEECNINVIVNSRVNSFKNKAGKDISCVIDYDYIVSTSVQSTEQYVTQIEENGAIETRSTSIIVYKPRQSESVFDIAKSLQISPDVILLQNPNLQDGMAEVKQVVVYKKVN